MVDSLVKRMQELEGENSHKKYIFDRCNPIANWELGIGNETTEYELKPTLFSEMNSAHFLQQFLTQIGLELFPGIHF